MLSNSNPSSLHSLQGDDFLPPISRWTTLGGVCLVGMFATAAVLASVVKYNTTVKAPAIVRPAGDLRIVQTAMSGTVRSIEVKDNQVVSKGDVIARLEDTQLQIQRNQLQNNIRQGKAQIAQLEAQLQTLEVQTVAESNAVGRTVAAAQADLVGSQRRHQDQQVITQADTQEAKEALRIAKSQLEAFKSLTQEGAVSRIQLQEREQAFATALANLRKAQAAQNPTTAEVQASTERIAQEQARGKSTLATLNRQKEELIQQSIALQTQMNQDQQALKQVETELNKSVVRATIDGTILKLNLRNAGQTVNPGELVAQIAPKQVPMVIKAQVAASDISKVKVCQNNRVEQCQEGKVQLRFSAYPYPDYGVLRGAVRAVAPDVTAASSKNERGGTTYYEVTIQPEKPYLKNDSKNSIQPGMEVTADIISREETVLTFALRKARLLADL